MERPPSPSPSQRQRVADEESAAVGTSTPPTNTSSTLGLSGISEAAFSEANSTQPLTASAGDSPLTGNHGLIGAPGRRTVLEKVKNAGRVTWRWMKGPDPPQVLRIDPLFPAVQTAPIRLRNMLFPKRKHKTAAYLAFISLWIAVFVIVVHYSRFVTTTEEQYGLTYQLGCTNAVWYRNNACGIDGLECGPFEDEYIPFRCPSGCLRQGRVLNYRAVGDKEIIYAPMVIGGPPTEASLPHGGKYNATYRADSFLCTAAVHAGVVSNRFGGCGLAKMTGEASLFPSSERNGIQSAGFDASFPASFTFQPIKSRHCTDLRWHLLPVSIFFTVVATLFITSPKLLFFTLFPAIFFHISFSSDPPFLANPHQLVSIAISRFLPDTFIAYIIGTVIVAKTINFSGQIEKCILWLGGIWVGALNNLTFEPLIPIARLTPRDIQTQPGAKAALAIICVVLFFIALSQAWFIRLTGQLPKYLALYVGMGATLGLLVAVPGQSVRIHHYILALILLPGTAFQIRPSLLYQGLLLGLHFNGVARWGFASLLETPFSLVGDGAMYTRLPRLEPMPIVRPNNVTIFWNATTEDTRESRGGFPYPWEGISLLINDVERHRSSDLVGNFTYERIPTDHGLNGTVKVSIIGEAPSDFGEEEGTLVKRQTQVGLEGSDAKNGTSGVIMQPMYFRIAYTRGTGSRISSGDYTRGAVVMSNGIWVPPADGRT